MNRSYKKSHTTDRNKSNIVFKIGLLVTFLFSTSYASACGYYLESLCPPPQLCRSELGLEPDATRQYCTLPGIKNKHWKTYPIDDSKDDTENCNGMNCWKYEDIIKNQLNMDSNQLAYAEPISGNRNPSLELQAHDTLQDGRYIYVIRTSDGKMVVRHYDQEYTTTRFFPLTVRFDYARFKNPNNYRIQGNHSEDTVSCSPMSLLPLGATCNYLHVRHSQLNGTQPAINGSYQNSDAWDPVYCAGELRVHNNKIDRINNQSDYFKPKAECVANVLTLLKALDIPVHKQVKAGDHKKVDTFEVFDCQNKSNELVPDIPDSQYHACGYIFFSQNPIGGILALPIYQGKAICIHKDIIWIWSHSHNCNNQIYSRGAEH